MDKNTDSQALENTSDRYSLRNLQSTTIKPALIPRPSIDFLKKMRRQGRIAPYPGKVIINNHFEISFSFASLTGIRSVLQKIESSGKKLQPEPAIETYDIYFVDSQISQRFRLYTQAGKVISVRIISVPGGGCKITTKKIAGAAVPFRHECVFVERSDPKDRNDILLEMDKFLSRYDTFSYIVVKHVERFTFGKETFWDHRKAVYKTWDGGLVDATEQLGVLGMGDFLNVNLQSYKMFATAGKLEKSFVAENVIMPIVNGSQNESAVKAIEDRVRPSQYSKLEIEFKGRFEKAIDGIVAQLITGFNQAGISYTFDSERKVSAKT